MLRQDQIRQLEGLPSHWRYALTGGGEDAKRCFEDEWNVAGRGHTLESVIRINETPVERERWKSRKMLGVGVITGEESNGLLVLDFDGVGSQAVRAFRKHFRRNPSALPKTAANISGKKGRAKLYFHVPPHWWPQFDAKSASWRSAEGNVVLEAIWQNGTGRGRHAVICGDHPESSHQRPLYYRWIEGFSPSESGIAEAPEWLLLGVLAQTEANGTERSREERLRSGEDDASPWERLTAVERRELVELALPHCPNREARGSGTYEKVRRILCGVLNEFGLEWAEELLCNSDWDRKNEWDSGMDCRKTLQSLAKSKVTDDHKARIATVFYFARESGWEAPSWAVPPVDMKVHVDGLKKLINQLHTHQNDSAAVALFIGRARKEYGVEPDTFRRLVLEQHLGTIERANPKTLPQIAESAHKSNVSTDVIDGFLGRRVHVVAGSSHCGKTTLTCFLANRVINGAPVDVDLTRHSSERRGRVLIFTSDCSDLDMVRDLALEGVDAESANDRLRVCSGSTFDDMLSICRILDEFAPDLVIYDCLTSMACADVRIGDPAYADPIRLLVRHNGLAWPKCAHVILHHTTRDEPTRFSGTEQIKAAAEELWLYYPPELLQWRRGTPRPTIGPTRHLVMEKSRSGYAGRVLTVTRNAYQGHWQFHQPSVEASSALEALTQRFRAVRHDRWQIASQWSKELDLAFNPRSLRRYLDQLVGVVLEVDRQRSSVTGRIDTHYRPRGVIRDAALAMTTSKGDGINEV
jgi:hypothetical protein